MRFAVYNPAFPGLPWARNKTLSWRVYLLIDPRDNTVRYVGVSRDPIRRLESHKSPGGATNWEMARWKLQLHDAGLCPKMAVVDSTCTELATGLEDRWMHYYVNAGYWLLNSCTNGTRKLPQRPLKRAPKPVHPGPSVTKPTRDKQGRKVRYPTKPHVPKPINRGGPPGAWMKI